MASKTSPTKVWHEIILESSPRTPAENAKLKPVLKRLLRQYGFKCIAARELQEVDAKTKPAGRLTTNQRRPSVSET